MSSTNRSWRSGPELPNQFSPDDAFPEYPGANYGMPREGSGAQASVARRMGAVAIDWAMCWIVAGFTTMFTTALGDTATLTLILWVILGIIGGWLFARTPGMALLGMGVARLDEPGQRVGLWRAAVRTVLTMFILPAALVDANGRGMHDRATGSTVIRS
ncbi:MULTISPECIES: RDD family protein [unclassified Corynebacterium]|uniref:RDD family protein n=1 Tax=unclassified Corynebacterium TaxID=2624378 RepID=UPI002A91C8DE|nr:RDD family protein [Corynebacterium sp.]MDY5785234.1 RDD family protein [Corynebacterium sp.]